MYKNEILKNVYHKKLYLTTMNFVQLILSEKFKFISMTDVPLTHLVTNTFNIVQTKQPVKLSINELS